MKDLKVTLRVYVCYNLIIIYMRTLAQLTIEQKLQISMILMIGIVYGDYLVGVNPQYVVS